MTSHAILHPTPPPYPTSPSSPHAMPSPSSLTPVSPPTTHDTHNLLDEIRGLLSGLKVDHDHLRQKVDAIASHPALTPPSPPLPTQPLSSTPTPSPLPHTSLTPPTTHPFPTPPTHSTLQPDLSAFLDPLASRLTTDASDAIARTASLLSTTLPGGALTRPPATGAAAGYPPLKPAGLEKFRGRMFIRGVTEPLAYDSHAYQYGTSTFNGDGSMMPALILYPHCDLSQPTAADDDVRLAIAYAVQRDVSIACRTGGHQYSGMSSTSGDNIQLDLSEAYPQFVWDDAAGLLRVGVSHGLSEFNTKLAKLGLFVPTGQCSHVHLGGHVQTGGYGQLARSFGLFADHIVQVRLILASGEVREVSKGSADVGEQELWFGVMGGSPGNWGVVTHATIAPHRDRDHPHARGLKALYPYHRDALQRLTQLMVDMSEGGEELDGDFDFCFSTLSGGDLVLPFFFPDNLDEAMSRYHRALYGNSQQPVVALRHPHLRAVGEPGRRAAALHGQGAGLLRPHHRRCR